MQNPRSDSPRTGAATIRFRKKNKRISSAGIAIHPEDDVSEVNAHLFLTNFATAIGKRYRRAQLGLDGHQSDDCIQEAVRNMLADPQNVTVITQTTNTPVSSRKGARVEQTIKRIFTPSRLRRPSEWASILHTLYRQAVNRKPVYGQQRGQGESRIVLDDGRDVNLAEETPSDLTIGGISLLDYTAYGKSHSLSGLIGNSVWGYIETTDYDENDPRRDNDFRINREISAGLILLFAEVLLDSAEIDLKSSDLNVASRGARRKALASRTIETFLKSGIAPDESEVGYTVAAVQKYLGREIDISEYRDAIGQKLNIDIANEKGWYTRGRRNPRTYSAGIDQILRSRSFKGASDATLILWDKLCTLGTSRIRTSG